MFALEEEVAQLVGSAAAWAEGFRVCGKAEFPLHAGIKDLGGGVGGFTSVECSEWVGGLWGEDAWE